MLKHTRGPWHRNIPPAKKYVTIYAGRNTHICHLNTIGLSNEEIEGNCNLIAAAPELLDALVELLERAEAAGETTGLPEYEQARKAVAKAVPHA